MELEFSSYNSNVGILTSLLDFILYVFQLLVHFIKLDINVWWEFDRLSDRLPLSLTFLRKVLGAGGGTRVGKRRVSGGEIRIVVLWCIVSRTCLDWPNLAWVLRCRQCVVM